MIFVLRDDLLSSPLAVLVIAPSYHCPVLTIASISALFPSQHCYLLSIVIFSPFPLTMRALPLLHYHRRPAMGSPFHHRPVVYPGPHHHHSHALQTNSPFAITLTVRFRPQDVPRMRLTFGNFRLSMRQARTPPVPPLRQEALQDPGGFDETHGELLSQVVEQEGARRKSETVEGKVR